MFSSLELLVVGHSVDFVQDVIGALANQPMVHGNAALIENGQLRSLSKSGEIGQADAIILCMDPGSSDSFRRIIDQLPEPLPLLFAISAAHDMDILRDAMRLGVRDYFQLPIAPEQLIEGIQDLVHQEIERHQQHATSTRLTAFINAKGGSGASFIAANAAMEMASSLQRGEKRIERYDRERRLLLMDLDFQFGGLPTYLSLNAGDGLIKALEYADTLDTTALRGYVQQHESGLHLLAAAVDDIMLPGDIGDERVSQLLSVIATAYSHLVVDLPRRIDTAVATLIHHADTIVVATQQSVAHMHDTKRLLFLLRQRIGIEADRVVLLLNRHAKKSDVGVEDYQNTFPDVRIKTLPSDYFNANESINLGVAISEVAPRSVLGKAMKTFAQDLINPDAATANQDSPSRKSLFGRFGVK